MRISKMLTLLATTLFAATTAVIGLAAPAQAQVKAVFNGGSIAIGVWLQNPAPTATKKYDDRLPAGANTTALGWPFAGGVYVGPGYCAQRWVTNSSGTWVRAGSDWLPGQYRLDGNYSVKIVQYRMATSTRCV